MRCPPSSRRGPYRIRTKKKNNQYDGCAPMKKFILKTTLVVLVAGMAYLLFFSLVKIDTGMICVVQDLRTQKAVRARAACRGKLRVRMAGGASLVVPRIGDAGPACGAFQRQDRHPRDWKGSGSSITTSWSRSGFRTASTRRVSPMRRCSATTAAALDEHGGQALRARTPAGAEPGSSPPSTSGKRWPRRSRPRSRTRCQGPGERARR